ncbi:MAG: DUF6701 domain-containing protein [Burkholderiales bacterium]
MLILVSADLAHGQAISYRGAGAVASAATGNVTPGLPTGWQPDDIHIAIIETAEFAASTMPAGWNLINAANHECCSDKYRATLFWRRALAGDTNPLVTWGGGTTIIARIIGFVNVDITTPLDVTPSFTVNGDPNNRVTYIRAGAITTVTADTMLVFTAHIADDTSTLGAPGAPTGSSPWTQAFYSDVAISGQEDLGIAAWYGLRSAVGVKPQVQSDWPVTSETKVSVGSQIALRPRYSAIVPGRFNVYDTATAAGAIVGFIKTKIAGTTINVDMIAVNAAKTAIDTTFTGTVKVEVLNASDNSAALDADACRSSWTVIQTLSNPTFIAGNNGRAPISFTEANSYPNVRLRVSYPTSAPTLIGCSTDNLAIRPNTLTSYSVTDLNETTAGTARTLNNTTAPPGGIIHKAGRPFTVQATAVNGAVTPATTTNYTGAPTPLLTDCGASNACPSTPGAVTLGSPFNAGVLNSTTASYNDVGSFSMQLMDTTFSNVDAADGSLADCTASGRYVCSGTLAVGRFVPDNFLVALNTPGFGTACGTFTYVGQKFNYVTQPVITVTARNSAMVATANYTGALWQITSASLSGKSYTAAAGTLDTSGITGTDPVISSGAGGVGTLTFGSGTGLLFTRGTPVAPFNADISLAINLNADADGVAIYASNPARFGQATAGNGIAFDSGKPMRFGRLVIRNASGSSLVPLRVRVEAQYWSSGSPTNAFITNTQDSCTTLAATNITMGNFQDNLGPLSACRTRMDPNITLTAGRGNLLLTAPGSANGGSVDLTIQLGSGAFGSDSCVTLGLPPPQATNGANRADLQGNWTGGAYNMNPSARATFGVFSGAEEIIFVRENF